MLLPLISAAMLLTDPTPPPAPPTQEQPAAERADAAKPETPALPQDTQAISLADLDSLRAGDDTHAVAISDQTLTAVNAGNSVNADQVSSGAMTLSDNAFTGFNGIGNFVMNTGHNNNLQGSISVTIAVVPQ